MGISDEELVAAVINGDTDAFAEIVARYKSTVFYAISMHISDTFLVEDIAQDTFLDAFLGLSSLREPSKISSYLFGIARRKALNEVRRRKLLHEELSDSILPIRSDASEQSPEDIFIEEEKRTAVRKAVYELSDKNRSAAWLFYMDELKIPEISERLDISKSAVKSRLFEARGKLKGALEYMKENTTNKSDKFDKTVMEKIRVLNEYYKNWHTKSISDEAYKSMVDDAMKGVLSMEESKNKHYLLADMYILGSAVAELTDEQMCEAKEHAAKGENAKVFCSMFLDELIKQSNQGVPYEHLIQRINNEAIPVIDKMNAKDEKGELLLWRAHFKMHIYDAKTEKYGDALSDYKEAYKLVSSDNIYKANALAGIRAIEFNGFELDTSCTISMNICADRLSRSDGKTLFISQPGIGGYNYFRYSSLLYCVSRCDGILAGEGLQEGEIYISKDGDVILKNVGIVDLEKYGECVHMQQRSDKDSTWNADMYYKDGVGLVRADFMSFMGTWSDAERYELCEYTVNGGRGLIPFAKGNTWSYRNTAAKDCVSQNITFEIDETNGEYANIAEYSIIGIKKDSEYEISDSETYISMCSAARDKGDIDKAISYLKEAVRINTSQNAVCMALAGIESLSRFAYWKNKGWRLCPSSISGSGITETDGKLCYSEAGVYSVPTPYRFGTRGEENRIFGIKPFRYLQALTGRIWDDEWKPGYERKFEYNGVTGKISVCEGGNITTEAGTFDETIKVITYVDRPVGKPYFYDAAECGRKEYYFAKGVGLVRHDCIWGEELTSRSELAFYSLPAAKDEYMPFSIGNRWEYDEMNLKSEGYRARRIYNVLCGNAGKYLLSDIQEFWYMGNEEAYDRFKADIK